MYRNISLIGATLIVFVTSGCGEREPITGNSEGPKRPAWSLQQNSKAGKGYQPAAASAETPAVPPQAGSPAGVTATEPASEPEAATTAQQE